MQLFVDIAKYTSRYMPGKRAPDDDNNDKAEIPDAKKRKIEDTALNALFSVPDTSFAVPQRKKMTLQLAAADMLRLDTGALRVVHEASGVNLAVPFNKIGRAHLM
jgi:hypothetical protein